MDACITTKPKKHIFISYSVGRLNPFKKAERARNVNVWMIVSCVICWWEGVASFVTSQGWLDANDVACNTLCARVKLCSQSERNQIVPILRHLASQSVHCEASVYWDSARKGPLCKPRIPPSLTSVTREDIFIQGSWRKMRKIYWYFGSWKSPEIYKKKVFLRA